MGSTPTKLQQPKIIITQKSQKELEQWAEGLKREAHEDKNKVEHVLAKIQNLRSRLQDKDIEIGDSSLSRLQQLEKEKAELLNRLSSLASDRMRNQNAKIADLSDTNRPTKLSERFSELYDNEWTDVFVNLKEQYANDPTIHDGERFAIETLLLILNVCYAKCTEIANLQRQKLSDLFKSKNQSKNLSMELRINECQKQIAETTIMHLQLDCEDLFEEWMKRKMEGTSRLMECLKMKQGLKYVKSCLEITWLMRIQSPPVILNSEIPRKDTSLYFRTYTRSGGKPDFVVWPVLFLHEDGPILSKGVIQYKGTDHQPKQNDSQE